MNSVLKKEQFNIKFISQVNMFRNCLQDIFENENFGSAITKEPNLYKNDAFQVQPMLKQEGSYPEDNFDSLTNILNRIFQKNMFYNLAK